MREASARIVAVSLVLSVAAVAGVKLGVASPLRVALEAIASPGEFLWWSTLGGAFSGYPSGLSGVLVWVLGSAAFWFIVLSIVDRVGSRLFRRRRS